MDSAFIGNHFIGASFSSQGRAAVCSSNRRKTGWRSRLPKAEYQATHSTGTGTALQVACGVLGGCVLALSVAVPSSLAQSTDDVLNERGARLFENTCAACHAGGGNVIGFARGKNLKSKALAKYGYDTKESIVQLMRDGKGIMPSYAKDKLSDDELEDIAEFVLQRAAQKWR